MRENTVQEVHVAILNAHVDGNCPESPSPDRLQPLHERSDTGGAGDDMDAETMASMRAEIARLKAANLALQEEVDVLKNHASQASGQEEGEDDVNVGADALRKRLKRLCERKKNGLLVCMDHATVC